MEEFRLFLVALSLIIFGGSVTAIYYSRRELNFLEGQIEDLEKQIELINKVQKHIEAQGKLLDDQKDLIEKLFRLIK